MAHSNTLATLNTWLPLRAQAEPREEAFGR